jgi:hypothetical protein
MTLDPFLTYAFMFAFSLLLHYYAQKLRDDKFHDFECRYLNLLDDYYRLKAENRKGLDRAQQENDFQAGC